MIPMNELMKTASRVSMVWLALSFILWVAIDQWRPVAAGFGAGTLISLANAYLLRMKVTQFFEAPAARSGKRSRSGLGFGMRTALVLFGALLALSFPNALNLPSILAGSFIVQITMLPVALWHTRRGRS